MADDQIRSDMEALMTRLVQTERTLMDTRQQIAAAPMAAAPLVDTRTIGKAPTFNGEHKDWPKWSFQFTAYMGSANPKSIEALRWAAMADGKITAAAIVQQSFEEHNAQLFVALALLCKGSALVTVKNTEVNNGLEAWRLNASYDSNNKGRQRERMQYLLQPKRAESIPQTTEAVERWECDVREYEQRFGKTLDQDVKIGVILALAPLQGKGKGENNVKTENFAGYCLECKGWGQMKKDCWWNENAESAKDTASPETLATPSESTKTEPPITGMLLQSDEGGGIPADPAQWMYPVTKQESVPIANDFLIDSGAATSVCQQSLADSLGGTPRGPGVELRSATGHQFTTTGNTTIS